MPAGLAGDGFQHFLGYGLFAALRPAAWLCLGDSTVDELSCSNREQDGGRRGTGLFYLLLFFFPINR